MNGGNTFWKHHDPSKARNSTICVWFKTENRNSVRGRGTKTNRSNSVPPSALKSGFKFNIQYVVPAAGGLSIQTVSWREDVISWCYEEAGHHGRCVDEMWGFKPHVMPGSSMMNRQEFPSFLIRQAAKKPLTQIKLRIFLIWTLM